MSSTDVAKKRGRPKKVVSEGLETESTAAAKKPTVRKTAKAATTTKTPAKLKVAKTPKILKEASPVEEDWMTTKSKSKIDVTATNTKSSTQAISKSEFPSTELAQSSGLPPITPENSKILAQVRELSSISAFEAESTNTTSYKPTASLSSPAPSKPRTLVKPAAASKIVSKPATSTKMPPKTSPPSKPVITSRSTAPSQHKSTPTPTTLEPSASKATPVPISTPPPAPFSKPTPPKIPIAALNSSIVSEISSRAGARPGNKGSQDLPKNYKSVSRKITSAIVAAPIAIVCSYVLYQRLVLGEEQKQLVKPSTVVDENSSSGESLIVNQTSPASSPQESS